MTRNQRRRAVRMSRTTGDARCDINWGDESRAAAIRRTCRLVAQSWLAAGAHHSVAFLFASGVIRPIPGVPLARLRTLGGIVEVAP